MILDLIKIKTNSILYLAAYIKCRVVIAIWTISQVIKLAWVIRKQLLRKLVYKAIKNQIKTLSILQLEKTIKKRTNFLPLIKKREENQSQVWQVKCPVKKRHKVKTILWRYPARSLRSAKKIRLPVSWVKLQRNRIGIRNTIWPKTPIKKLVTYKKVLLIMRVAFWSK